MKKLLRLGILCGVLTLLLCVSALAAGEKGIYGISSESGFTVAATGETQNIDVDRSEAVNMQNVYLNAASVSVTYTDAGVTTEKQYLLIVTDEELTGDRKPTSGNIQYINQDAPAAAGSVTFSTVYPKSLTSGKTYYIYLAYTEGGGLAPAGTFKYYAAYKLGDVNDDKSIDAVDALWVLQKAAGKRTLEGDFLLAADVNDDHSADAVDALWILQKAAGKRSF